jgi:hypothetical protein
MSSDPTPAPPAEAITGAAKKKRKIKHPPDPRISLNRTPTLTSSLITRALAQFEETVGGREELVKILTYGQSPSTESELVINLLADPQNAEERLSFLCARAGLSVGRFLNLFSQAKSAEAYVRAMDRVYPHVPQVAGEVMELALISWDKCRPCDGSGQVKVTTKAGEELEIRCGSCDGLGKIKVVPDLERQEMALKLGGLLKPAAPSVVIDQSKHETTNVSMRSFIAATNRLLYGSSAEPLEAQVVPEGED